MSLSYIYGPKFRKIRRFKHISEQKATKVANISRATLERWERGERDLSLEKVLKLLKLVHVQQNEFLQDDILEQLKEISQEISDLYVSNNTTALKEIVYFHIHKSDHLSFYKAIIAANYYSDLTGQNLFSQNEKDKILSLFQAILSGNENWRSEDIFLFGNVQTLLDSRTIYELFFSLINFFTQKSSNNNQWNSMVLNTLLNAEFTLIKIDFNRAKKVNTLLKQIKLPDTFALEKIRIKLFDSLIFYIQTKDDYQIKENQIILEYENFAQLSDGFNTAVKQIKKIYDHI